MTTSRIVAGRKEREVSSNRLMVLSFDCVDGIPKVQPFTYIDRWGRICTMRYGEHKYRWREPTEAEIEQNKSIADRYVPPSKRPSDWLEVENAIDAREEQEDREEEEARERHQYHIRSGAYAEEMDELARRQGMM